MRVDLIIPTCALLLAVLSVLLERRNSKASEACMLGAYGLVGLLIWCLWG